MKWNVLKTKSERPRKLSLNAMNFSSILGLNLTNFWPFFMAWMKCIKLQPIFDGFSMSFLQNLVEIFWIFTELNKKLWNFKKDNDILFTFDDFVEFHFCLHCFQKLTAKFWSCSDSFEILKFHLGSGKSWKIQHCSYLMGETYIVTWAKYSTLS
jgi:hypothetical protein